MIIKMPDASDITRQRLANAVVTGNRFSNNTHSTMGSIQKKLENHGLAYKAPQIVCPTQSDLFNGGDLKASYTLPSGCSLTLTGVLRIPAGMSLTVSPGSTLTINTTFSNAGTILNGGTINNTAGFNNTGTITNTGTINSTNAILTSGTINNSGTITFNVGFSNSGTINNGGTINNSTTSYNNFGATIYNNFGSTINGPINNQGTIVNYYNGFAVRNVTLDYNTSLTAELPLYDYNTYPTALPTALQLVTVTGIPDSNDNISYSEFLASTNLAGDYDSFWLETSPTQPQILDCLVQAYSANAPASPAFIKALKVSNTADGEWVIPFPPTLPGKAPATIYVLIVPYDKAGSTTFTLKVKNQDV